MPGAIGFASSSPHALAALAFTVLPTVFVLGWFTIVRLIDTSGANVVSLRRIELIRRYGPRPGSGLTAVPGGWHPASVGSGTREL